MATAPSPSRPHFHLAVILGILFLYLLTAPIFQSWAFVYQSEHPPIPPSPSILRPGFAPIVKLSRAYAWPYHQLTSIPPLTALSRRYEHSLDQHFIARRVSKEGHP